MEEEEAPAEEEADRVEEGAVERVQEDTDQEGAEGIGTATKEGEALARGSGAIS